MRDKLPVLFEGHAPAGLHEAFDAAIAAFEDWTHGDDEPVVAFGGVDLPISVLFGRLRACTDLLPARVRGEIEAIAGEDFAAPAEPVTYADAAKVLRTLCVEQMKAALPKAATLSASQINALRASRLRVEG